MSNDHASKSEIADYIQRHVTEVGWTGTLYFS